MNKKSEIVIIVLSMLVVGLLAYIIVDKSANTNISSTNNTEIQDSKQIATINEVDSKNAVISEKQNEETKIRKDEDNPVANKDSEINKINDGGNNSDESENKKDDNSNDSKEVSAIKKALKDKNWLEENVMMKESCFVDVPITGKQELTFMRVVGSDYKPMIIVEAYSEEDISVQDFMVYYKDGKVISKPLTTGALHISHAGVGIDPNNAKMLYNYMHMGYGQNILYDLKDGNVKYVRAIAEQYRYEEDLNGEDSKESMHYYRCSESGTFENSEEISEEEYFKILEEFGKYDFYEISTDLTDSNIDKYVR